MHPAEAWCPLCGVLAYYVHDLSPFLLRFSEKFGLRWYGLAYVAGFIVGYFLLRSFVRRGYCQLRESQLSDFVTLGALFGVMLGGRLGYMLFYKPAEFFADPIIFFHFLDGGMASHGGIIGLVVFTFVYARKKGITWRGIGDNLCTVAPLGLCFGRLANFINGELYGRKSEVPWAVQFPEEIRESEFLSPDGRDRADLAQALAGYDFPPPVRSADGALIYPDSQVIEAARHDESLQEVLSGFLNPRHPSQIYQALLEGLLLFLVLYSTRLRFPQLRHGILTGMFFIGYAALRIAGEQFREPSDGFVGPFTRGQFLSLFMVVVGLLFIASTRVWPYRQKVALRRTVGEAP